MDERQIRHLIERVRGRWRRLMTLRAAVRAALAAAAVLGVALLASRWLGRAPLALAAIGVLAVLLIASAVAWNAWALGRPPSDTRVARFIEEADPSLDDRLASAVALAGPTDSSPRPALADAMLADASRRAAAVDPGRIVPTAHLRRAGIQAAAAVLLLVGIAFTGRATARQSFDAFSLSLFPSHTKLDVAPGDARIRAGTTFTIDARVVGNTAPVSARLLRADADRPEEWHAADMSQDADGAFHLSFEPNGSFKYRVGAGAVLSPVFAVTVARPPRVTRIDLDYTFPRELGLAPRVDEDTGDIYAPAGTDVRLHVHTDREVASGAMNLAAGRAIHLVRESATILTTSISVSDDGSYRLTLTDAGGLTSVGDTEYFIRTLQDRPPDVHVLHPARDKEVTRLEEVDVQARADDDFGVASMDLVYAVNGGPQKVAPIAIPRQAVSATGTTTLYLEDLKVAPGDFISYFVRARDIGRGKRSSETKSDLFFLQVRPFDQEFTLADGQGAGGGRQLDDLVQAQKDVVISTWKLDRRSQAAGASSPDDVRAVAQSEAELRTRVEEAASAFRESTLRDPRARGGAQASPPRPGEENMTAAAAAMGKAAATLGELKTTEAVPPEMDALNHLLQAQADIKQRQVQSQQAGSGNGQNRSNLDLSNLFDRELQRQQRTNYEAKSAAVEHSDDTSALDKVRDLARRQDELNERQKELATRGGQLGAEEMKRELEQLTREQSDLRQKAEELAQSLSSQNSQSGADSRSSSGSKGSAGSKSSQGSEGARSAADAMSKAAGSLRQQNPGQASQQGAQAADRLRALADRLASEGAGGADARRRALGDMQLEARRIADAQRQVAASLDAAGRGEQPADTMRRLAGEEEQLAARAGRLQQDLGRQAAAAAGASSADGDAPRALAGAARDFERQRVGERMQQAADAIRAAAGQAQQAATQGADRAAAQAAAGRQAARDLDRLAETLSSASAPQDAESRKLADTRARADALRAEIDRLAAQIKDAKTAADVARLRGDYATAMQQAQQLLEQVKRDDPALAQQAGPGFTFEGQGMTLSAPGTEAFKQDFAKWDQLRLRAADALSKAETSIDAQLQAKRGNERLPSGVDDQAPAGYESQVSSYFKALADRKR